MRKSQHIPAVFFIAVASLISGIVCIEAFEKGFTGREKEFRRQIENISLDLHTPLTVILGYLKIMKKEDKELNMDEKLAETLEIIERKAETMETLVIQLYDFSRLNAGLNDTNMLSEDEIPHLFDRFYCIGIVPS